MRKSFFKGTHWKENTLQKLELYKPAVWPHMKWCWPFVPPCKWYLTLAIITVCCRDRWAPRRMAEREQSAGGCGCARPWVHYRAHKASLPALRNHFGVCFAFPPSPLELSQKTGHTEQSQQAGSFPFTFLCPLEAKVVPHLWREVYEGALPPRAPQALMDSLLCPFPCRERGFPFTCGKEPRALLLGAHRLVFSCFHSLRSPL